MILREIESVSEPDQKFYHNPKQCSGAGAGAGWSWSFLAGAGASEFRTGSCSDVKTKAHV